MGQSDNDYRVNWHRVAAPGSARAYLIALALVILATVLRSGLGLISEDILPFLTYFPAVLFAALFGGLGPGIFAAVLGAIIGWWAFMQPYFLFTFANTGQEISVSIYLVAALLIVWGADRYRTLTQKLEDEEKFRKLAVEELSHRLKNKIATIQAIISFQLRDNPEIRDAIIGRLIALSGTDDLIMQTQGRGARLREILSAELGPYESSRVSIAGPVVLLPPKVAMTMALLVHELATNAAKYGALSNATGHLAIGWSYSDGPLNLIWHESGGPIVATPTHNGFGMKLISRALSQFDGACETNFEATGLICKMRVRLPTNAEIIEPNNDNATTVTPRITV
jgi:two-component sensor histidine kinase